MTALLLVLLGLTAGLLSGLVGIGGGVVIVPALVLFFGYSQKLAQGTTLALLLPPIGILAVLTYAKAGSVDFKAAAFMVGGFVIGGYFGAKLVTHLPDVVVAKAFGVFLLALAVKFIFFTK
jgi:uncharacterized membrane protein YfcA